MNQCVKEVVAFGMNQTELDLVACGLIAVGSIVIGKWLLNYLSPSSSSFITVDEQAEKERKRRGYDI